MANIPIWEGSATFDLSQKPTPFGFYDSDTEFQTDAPKVADWCAQRLGYPLVDIELQQENFFAAFEEAITEYGSHVYQFQIINNMGDLIGFNTGSGDFDPNDPDANHLSDNTGAGLNNIDVSSVQGDTVSSTNYGNESQAGSGASSTGRLYSASLHVKRGIQKYNLLSSTPEYASTTIEWGSSGSPSGSNVFGGLTHSSSIKITDTDGVTVHYRATTGSSNGGWDGDGADPRNPTVENMTTGSGEFREYVHASASIGEFATGSYNGRAPGLLGSGITGSFNNNTIPGTDVGHLSASVSSFISTIKNGPHRKSFTISSSLSSSGNFFITLTQTVEGTGGNTQITSNLTDFATGLKADIKTSTTFTGGTSALSFESSGSQIQALSKRIDIKKIYHYQPAAINRYFDPYAGTGTGIQSLMQTFGFGNYSPGVNFMLMPMYFDALKLQAIEMNDTIRKSAYHFELNGKHLRLFPIPTSDYTLWFDYTMANSSNDLTTDESDDTAGTDVPKPTDIITNQSNVPYVNPTYSYINAIGRQWIRKYALALTKEMLGGVRGKYQTIPIPGDDTTLDYSRLLSEAQAEKDALVIQLREDLEKTNTLAQQTMNSDIAAATQDTLGYTDPYQIYIH